jgi:iron complex outermembrane receptor protein
LSYDVYALSGMWNWQATSALSLTSAVRFDTLELEREGDTLPLMPFTNADYSRDFSEWSYNLGAVYKLSDNDSLRFSAARGIGSPSLLEYGFQLPVPPPGPGVTAFYLGDPATAPTIVYNAEIGWDHNIPSINGRLRASLFWQKNEDLRMLGAYSQVFSLVPTVAGTLAGNIGESEMQGFEIGVEGQQGRIHWDAQYSYRDISDDFETLTSPTAQANFEDASPEHVVTGGVMWIGDRWEFGADARYTSETQQFGQGAVLTGFSSVDSYVQLNALAAWRASDTLRL